MNDPRLDQLAQIILSHSLHMTSDEIVNITSDLTALPLASAIVKRANQMGIFATVELTSQELSRQILEGCSTEDAGRTEQFMAKKTAWGLRRFEDIAANIFLRAYSNDQELAGIPPAVRQLEAKIAKPLKDLIINERRWVLFEYPTPGQAQRAGVSFEKYFDFVFDVACVDYVRMSQDVRPLVDLMKKTDRVRLIGPGTDLRFSIKDIPVIPCCGECNIPDGEVFTAPVKESINGTIAINTPTIYWGKTITGIRFELENGRICKATADTNEEALNKVLDTDPGARYIGEFSIGINPKIREPFCNTLFDEKICGSFHFTPGACYAEASNGNDSSVHWDLVTIQRPEYGGGEIWFDDVLIRKDGLFVLPELLSLNP
jgi:aminopeptidase